MTPGFFRQNTVLIRFRTAMATDTDDLSWEAPRLRAIGRAILESEHDALIPREVAVLTDRDASNTKHELEAMADAGLVERRAPARRQPGSGRRAQWAYAVAPTEEATLRKLLPPTDRVTLRAGEHLVFASMAKPEDLAEVLSDPDQTQGGSWYALSDGDPQEYVIAFKGKDALINSRRLVAVLTAANVTCRRAHISEVGDICDLASRSEEEMRAARAIRMRQRTRRTTGTGA